MLVAFSINKGGVPAFLIFDINTPVVKCYAKVYKGRDKEEATCSLKVRETSSNTGGHPSYNLSLLCVRPTLISA